MRISQDNEFKPVTIVIESEIELAELYNAINAINGQYNYKTCIKINTFLYENNIMTSDKVNKILNENS